MHQVNAHVDSPSGYLMAVPVAVPMKVFDDELYRRCWYMRTILNSSPCEH